MRVLRHKYTHTYAKSNRYGDCCLKRGIRWKETLNELIENRLLSGSFDENQQLAAAAAMLRRAHFAAGGTEESLSQTCRDAHAEARKLLLPVIENKVKEEQCHAAFAFAMERCDFLFARPWRHANQLTITKV